MGSHRDHCCLTSRCYDDTTSRRYVFLWYTLIKFAIHRSFFPKRSGRSHWCLFNSAPQVTRKKLLCFEGAELTGVYCAFSTSTAVPQPFFSMKLTQSTVRTSWKNSKCKRNFSMSMDQTSYSIARIIWPSLIRTSRMVVLDATLDHWLTRKVT